MSTYTISEILIWLVLAAALGFALGWITRELRVRAKRPVAVAEPVNEPATVAEPVAEPAAVAEPANVQPEPEPEPELELDLQLAPEPAATPVTPDAGPGEPPTPEHVIKGKTKSMIYHAPSSGSYRRTKADVWFRTEEEAIAAGYRKPKNG